MALQTAASAAIRIRERTDGGGTFFRITAAGSFWIDDELSGLSSPGRLLWWRLVSVRECLQERYDLVFLFVGQPQVANRRVPVLRDLRIWPARHLLSLRAILTTRKFVARVVEVDDFLQALEVA